MICLLARKLLVGVSCVALPGLCMQKCLRIHCRHLSSVYGPWSAVCTFIVLLWQRGCWRKTIKDIQNIPVNIPGVTASNDATCLTLSSLLADRHRPRIILFFPLVYRTRAHPILLLSSSFPVKITTLSWNANIPHLSNVSLLILSH